MIILQWIFELDKWKYFVNSKLFDHQCRYAYCVCNMYGHLATQIEIFCEMKQNCGKKKIGLDLMFVAQKNEFLEQQLPKMIFPKNVVCSSINNALYFWVDIHFPSTCFGRLSSLVFWLWKQHGYYSLENSKGTLRNK